jgi:hypothetical protein
MLHLAHAGIAVFTSRSTDRDGIQFEARLPARKFRKYVPIGRIGGTVAGSGTDEKEVQAIHAEEVTKA